MKLTSIIKLLTGTTLLSLSLPIFAASNDAATLDTIATIDKAEILAAIEAKHMQPSTAVMDFADMMISDHGQNLTDALVLANKLNATAMTAEAASDIRKQNAKDLIKLASLTGKDFEKAYIDAMVKGHEDALKLLDTKLIPKAKTPELVQFLNDTKTAVMHHLEMAKKIQKDMV